MKTVPHPTLSAITLRPIIEEFGIKGYGQLWILLECIYQCNGEVTMSKHELIDLLQFDKEYIDAFLKTVSDTTRVTHTESNGYVCLKLELKQNESKSNKLKPSLDPTLSSHNSRGQENLSSFIFIVSDKYMQNKELEHKGYDVDEQYILCQNHYRRKNSNTKYSTTDAESLFTSWLNSPHCHMSKLAKEHEGPVSMQDFLKRKKEEM